MKKYFIINFTTINLDKSFVLKNFSFEKQNKNWKKSNLIKFYWINGS